MTTEKGNYRKCKVIMLPTEKESPIFIGDKENHLILTDWSKKSKNWFFRYKYQHLYILSDEEIKEGDSVIHKNRVSTVISGDIYQAEKPIGSGEFRKSSWCTVQAANTNKYPKIISTTDSLLRELVNSKSAGFDEPIGVPLPKPSQSFITKFIEKYNAGVAIVDVMVEYHPELYDGTETTTDLSGRLKVDSRSNTITIRAVKDSWSRDEVIALMKLSIRRGVAEYGLEDQWIKENL